MDAETALSESVRRLPVYFLLDCSGDMAGSSIFMTSLGLKEFKRQAEAVKEARETIYVGIITFGSYAKFQTEGLVALADWDPPTLSAGGSTNLGCAFEVLLDSYNKDVKKNIPGQEKGDWRPLIFLLMDGFPDSGWEAPRKEVLMLSKSGAVNIITVGCGTSIDEEALKRISTGYTFKMSDSEADFAKFFQWITQCVVMASVRLNNKQAWSAQQDVPPPPNCMVYLDV